MSRPAQPPRTEKSCKACDTIKPTTEFYSYNDKHSAKCKPCHNLYCKTYYHSKAIPTPEQRAAYNEYMRDYRKKNSEKTAAYQREYHRQRRSINKLKDANKTE